MSSNDVSALMDWCVADFVLTDPPYNITYNDWDKPIDLDTFWKIVHTNTKKNAAYIVFSCGKFTPKLANSNLNEYRYDLVWQKTQPIGFLNANRMPLRQHENILVFYRNLPTYNPQKINGKAYNRIVKGNAFTNNTYSHTTPKVDMYNTGFRYPTTILKYSNHCGMLWGKATDKTNIHSAHKPVDLLKWLINSYSNEGDIVLDLFGGSGSTLIACEETGRKCRMMELSPEYCDVIIKRWENLTGRKAEKLE